MTAWTRHAHHVPILTNRQPGHQIVNHHVLQGDIGEAAIGAAVPQLDLAGWVTSARG
jgi:hypothetical protein